MDVDGGNADNGIQDPGGKPSSNGRAITGSSSDERARRAPAIDAAERAAGTSPCLAGRLGNVDGSNTKKLDQRKHVRHSTKE